METARNLGVEGNDQGAGRASLSAALGLSATEPPVTNPPATPPADRLGCVHRGAACALRPLGLRQPRFESKYTQRAAVRRGRTLCSR